MSRPWEKLFLAGLALSLGNSGASAAYAEPITPQRPQGCDGAPLPQDMKAVIETDDGGLATAYLRLSHNIAFEQTVTIYIIDQNGAWWGLASSALNDGKEATLPFRGKTYHITPCVGHTGARVTIEREQKQPEFTYFEIGE